MKKPAKRRREAVSKMTPEIQEYNLWTIPSDVWQKGLAEIHVAKEIMTKIRSLRKTEVATATDEQDLERKLEPYTTVLNTNGLKFSVG